MSAQGNVRFIRKNGKIIPIAMAASAGARVTGQAAKAATAAATKHFSAPHSNKTHPAFKKNMALDAAGLGLSIASGVVAAATFATPKGFLAGHAAAHAIDALGVSANVASVTGKGHGRERAQAGAKQELRNLAIGNAVYFAGVAGFKQNRSAAKAYGVKAIGVAKKIVELGRKALLRG